MRYSYFVIIVLVFQNCSFTKSVKTGADAFERKQYAVAIDLLKEEYENSKVESSRAEISYLLGRCMSVLHRYKEASFWYSEAVENGKGTQALREFAYSLKRNEQYREAIGVFKKLKKEGGNDLLINKEIGITTDALASVMNSKKENFKIESLGFNTPENEYSPVLYEKNYLVFTSDRADATGADSYNWTGNAFSDLFIIEKSSSTPVLLFDDELNTFHNEGAACFSQDFNQIFFTRCQSDQADDYCKLMFAERRGNGWSEAQAVFEGAALLNYGQPTLIENDSVLVFSSNQNFAENGFDLYYSVLEEEGWSTPEPMPSSINSDGNERFPTSDGDTLYFSSDKLPGFGGLDIFKTYLVDGNSWSKPENIGYPLNRGSDDFGYLIDRTIPPFGELLIQGFFSSDRAVGEGDNIFRFYKYKPQEPEIIVDTNIVVAPPVAKNIRLALRVGEYVYQDENDPKSAKIAKDPVRSQEVKMVSGDSSWVITTDRVGRAFTELRPAQDYTISVKKEGYLYNQLELSTKNIDVFTIDRDTTINAELLIDRIFVDKEIVLDNIYYDLNKSNIREDAEEGLNFLVDLMKNNPDVNIELASHTDCQGFDEYNMDLSQRRAESAVNYIVSQGIAKNRLSAIGYGESRLAVSCDCLSCSEEEHQINRRTTFKVLK